MNSLTNTLKFQKYYTGEIFLPRSTDRTQRRSPVKVHPYKSAPWVFFKSAPGKSAPGTKVHHLVKWCTFVTKVHHLNVKAHFPVCLYVFLNGALWLPGGPAMLKVNRPWP